jgi:hypothetical protein
MYTFKIFRMFFPTFIRLSKISHVLYIDVSDLLKLWFSPGIPVSSTNKMSEWLLFIVVDRHSTNNTYRHDITEILLKSGIEHY